MHFTNNDGSKNTFLYQPTLYTLELKTKARALTIFLVGNHREYIILNLSHYTLFSYIA